MQDFGLLLGSLTSWLGNIFDYLSIMGLAAKGRLKTTGNGVDCDLLMLCEFWLASQVRMAITSHIMRMFSFVCL